MNWNTAGTRKAWVTRRAPIRSMSAAGSISRTITDVPPYAMPANAQPAPPMWNSGMATIETIVSSKPQISRASSTMAKALALLSITPLGRPVVPEL